MNHITEQEAREAARSLKLAKADLDEMTKEGRDTQFIEQTISLRCGQLACFAVDELSRRDAERAEREKPIDAEWLASIGASLNEWNTRFPIHVLNAGTHVIGWAERRGVFAWNNGISYLFDGIATRGQLLDLLAALKGGAS